MCWRLFEERYNIMLLRVQVKAWALSRCRTAQISKPDLNRKTCRPAESPQARSESTDYLILPSTSCHTTVLVDRLMECLQFFRKYKFRECTRRIDLKKIKLSGFQTNGRYFLQSVNESTYYVTGQII